MKAARTPDYSLWQDFLVLAGRVLMGWIFVQGGWGKLMNMDEFIAGLANRRLPFPTVLGWIGAPAEFFGGLAIMLGLATRCGALLIILFVIVATAISHRYWEFTDAALRRAQQGQFAKNVTIIGGLVLLVVTGGGRFSVDGWRRR